MHRARRLLPIAFLLALVAAGCGGGHPKTKAQLIAKRCPAGNSYMGCAQGNAHQGTNVKPKAAFGPVKAPSGCKIPDVSSWQGHPDWQSAKSSICGGIAKAGEYSQDPDFTYNWAALKGLGLWHTSYWYIRNTGCSHEVSQYISILNSVGYRGDRLAGPPVLDMESPEAYNYATCMANGLRAAFGVSPVIYTAPGTWPGGSANNLLAWVAAYGPSSPPCLPWTCSNYVAWQFAAPPWVNFYIPGLGYQDVSVNYTFTGLRPFAGPPPPPPLPKDPLHYRSFALGPPGELLTVQQYDGARKHPIKYAGYLHKILEPRALFYADRINRLARAHGKPNWAFADRGLRQSLLRARAHGDRFLN